MDLIQYQSLAKRTLVDLGNKLYNNIHLVLGIQSEFMDELFTALEKNDAVNIKEEIGDIYWYVANWFNVNGREIKVTGNNIFISNIIGQLADVYKKELAYKKETAVENIEPLMSGLLYYLRECCVKFNIQESDVLQTNINKLSVRYPDKFTEEKAVNRDLEAERKTLEKNA